MPIKTTITPHDNQAPEIGSLWKAPDGYVYVLVMVFCRYATLQPGCLNKCWSAADDIHEAVADLVPFRGTVTIELGGV